MSNFKVRYFEGGVGDKKEPRDIEAQDEQEAAEKACGGGERLIETGKIGQLRAEVWLPSSPGEKKLFYVPPQPISN